MPIVTLAKSAQSHGGESNEKCAEDIISTCPPCLLWRGFITQRARAHAAKALAMTALSYTSPHTHTHTHAHSRTSPPWAVSRKPARVAHAATCCTFAFVGSNDAIDCLALYILHTHVHGAYEDAGPKATAGNCHVKR